MRKYDMAFNERLIEEVLETGNAILIAGKYGIHSSPVNRWAKTNEDEPYKKLQNSAPASYQCPSREHADLKSALEQNQQFGAIIGKKKT